MTDRSGQIARRRLPGAALAPLLLLAGCAAGGALQTPAPTLEASAQLAAEADSLRAWADRAPGEAYWPYRLAALYAAADSLPAAAAALETALAADPRYAPALSLRAKLHYEVGEYGAGAALLRAALAAGVEPRVPLTAALALHLDALGEWEESARLVGTLEPPTPATAAALGFLLLRGEDPFASEARLRAAVTAAPRSAAAANNLGIGLLYAGRPDAAAAEFERALGLDADCAGAHYNLALLALNYRFDAATARAHFTAYRRLAPRGEDPDALGQSLAAAPAAGALALSPNPAAAAARTAADGDADAH
ncbi:hypothetical protein FJ251_03960 [bacterium]|nr:hypothetical protein [bacterium]